MDAKKAGIVALVVLAVGILAWSFKSSFMNDVPVAGSDQAAKMRESMKKLRESTPPTPTGKPKPGEAAPHSPRPTP